MAKQTASQPQEETLPNDATGGASAKRAARSSLKVFAVFFALYLVTWGGHYTSGDGAQKVAWAKAMLGTPAEASPPSGGVYSKYGIGHSLIALPPLAVANSADAARAR